MSVDKTYDWMKLDVEKGSAVQEAQRGRMVDPYAGSTGRDHASRVKPRREIQAPRASYPEDLVDYLGRRVTARKIAELMRTMDALKESREPLRNAIGLRMNGPFYDSQTDTYNDFGLKPPVLGFVSVGGSGDIWTALQMPLLNGDRNTLPAVAMSRIDIANRRFDPGRPRRFEVGDKGNIEFRRSGPEGNFFNVNLDMDPSGIIGLWTNENTGLYVLANPAALV